MHDEAEHAAVEVIQETNDGTISLNPDVLILNSVGIDIGSSTSHITFSRLTLERRGTQFSSRFEVVEREVLYRSPILLTPYRDSETIDMEPLTAFIEQCYRESGISPSQTNTGAVICTGEAVRKKNSEAITRMFSSQGGKFVCATAGPRLEGVLASHGSGAVARSRQHDGVLMNVDLGGGTSKVTLVRDGAVLETGAINVGARLVAWDPQGRLVRIEDAGRKVAESVGVSVELGQVLSEEQRRAIAQALAEILFEYLRRGTLSPLTTELLVTEAFTNLDPVNGILFSGGVGEYVSGRDTKDYGDLGPLYGEEIRKRLPGFGIPVIESMEQIRATVIGASQYTIQLSSSTIYLSRPDVLPQLDRQVVAPNIDGAQVTSEAVAQAIHASLKRADLLEIDNDRPIALFIRWPFDMSYSSLNMLSTGIVSALESRKDDPWVLVFDADIGGLVGSILKEEMGVKPEVVCVDEIAVGDLDFVDIGEEIKNRQAVPVVVKSLVFG